MAITKPALNIPEALAFATEQPRTEKLVKGKGKGKIIAHTALNETNKARIFFAPEGDKRLTINLKVDLHKKLKIAAIEKDITAGEIIEQLLERYL